MHIFNFFGYLDAGTGSVVIQSIIGIAAGIGVFGRKAIGNIGHKIKSVFTKSEQESKPAEK